MTSSRLRCTGCGFEADGDEQYPFRCPNAGRGDDVDHVLARVLDPRGLEFPTGDEPHPFVRYRTLLHSYQWARDHGIADDEWCDLIGELDGAVAAVAGRGLAVSLPRRSDALSNDLGYEPDGGVWTKDETHQPGGSHKVRHLFGIAAHLLAVERATAATTPRPLAIASCGNAALAAAIVARALDRPLQVFVPEWADPPILEQLRTLGAEVASCTRDETETAGDPCVTEVRAAVASGAVPFGCQGPDNALTLDGGRTLAWELASAGIRFDEVYVQVGGGALASSLAQGLEEAAALGTLAVPRVMAVQTAGGAPLARAYERVAARVPRHGIGPALTHAARHRSQYMWPWDPPPRSAATGILDDEVYDWWAVVAAMLRTDGRPVVIPEPVVAEAGRLAGSAADATGAAGLAGVLTKGANPADRTVVLFTGRSPPGA